MAGLPPGAAHKYPSELSGGMRQRVFIAMAICLHPPLLLIDEPTTALDPASKQQILQLLRNIHSEYGTTMLIVSHDLEVIERLTDNLMVLLHGSSKKVKRKTSWKRQNTRTHLRCCNQVPILIHGRICGVLKKQRNAGAARFTSGVHKKAASVYPIRRICRRIAVKDAPVQKTAYKPF